MREVTLTIQSDEGDEIAEDILADELERLDEYIFGRVEDNDGSAEITAAVIIMAKALLADMAKDNKARMN
jgi:hypothetical protein